MYVYMYVCMYKRMSMHVCTVCRYTGMHLCKYVCINKGMYACMYVLPQTFKNFHSYCT